MIGTERNGDGQQQEHGMQVQFMYTRVYQDMLGSSCSVRAWHGIYNTKGGKQYGSEMMQQYAALLGCTACQQCQTHAFHTGIIEPSFPLI